MLNVKKSTHGNLLFASSMIFKYIILYYFVIVFNLQASNYEALKTPHYDYFGDLDTENDTDSELFQTPRSLSAGYSQRSADTPTRAPSNRNQEQDKQPSGYRTPYYFHMPSLSSPMPSRPKSPECDTSSKNMKKNTYNFSLMS